MVRYITSYVKKEVAITYLCKPLREALTEQNMRLSFLFLLLISASCVFRPVQQAYYSAETEILADSILGWGLDHEALYTVMGDLKPMSSLAHLYLPLAADSLHQDGDAKVVDPQHPDLARLRAYQKALAILENDSLGFFIGPFAMAQGQTRVMQVLVYKKSTIKAMVERYQSFFGQFGITPETDPDVLIQVIEQAGKGNRYRGYGYLFGYPEHAVNFFVEASRQQDETGNFVERDFYQIPVFAGDQGYFVYATPKGYVPGQEDIELKEKAAILLEEYRQIRKKYLIEGRLMARKLLMEK